MGFASEKKKLPGPRSRRFSGLIFLVALLGAGVWLAALPRPGVATASPQTTPQPTVDVSHAIEAYCGSSFVQDNSAEPAHVSSYACRPDWVESGPEQVYLFHLLETQAVTVTLNSLLPNVDLDLFLLTSADPASCLAAGNTGLQLADLSGGRDYYLVVDGYQGGAGPYSLAIRCPLGPQATATPTPTATRTPTPTATRTATPTATPTAGPLYMPLSLWRAHPTPTPPLQTLVLQMGRDGYMGQQDTTLDSWNPTLVHGSDETLLTRWNRDAATAEKAPLIRFGLGYLPVGAHVVGARLDIYTTERTVATDVGVALYGMQRLWNESQTTWERASTAQAWTVPGAAGAGSDRDAGPASTATLDGVNRWFAFDVPHLVRRWQANPAGNAGMLLKATAGSENGNVEYVIASAQYPVAAQRPKLTITYWVP